ncbi:MAG: tetratricopeptide repeat protein [Proteobacteria bacterium]|nr:tetratricopeptide repeat protein [Pseudomonadota bacterium]
MKRKQPVGPSAQDLQAVSGALRAGMAALARTLAQELVDAHPGHAEAHVALGRALAAQRRLPEAAASLRRAVALKPGLVDAQAHLSTVLIQLGDLAAAEAPCRRALALRPGHGPLQGNLALLLLGLGRAAEAEAAARRAIALAPAHAPAHNTLGIALLGQGRLAEAEACYRRATALSPDYAEAHSNLGVALIEQGRFAEAQDGCRRALALQPDYHEAHSNLIFALNYVETADAEALCAEARRYGDAVSAAAGAPYTQWRCAAVPPARLRVGFVSGDLREHPVGHFLQAALAAIDRSRFELIAYPSSDRRDAMTARLQPLFERWQPLVGLDDAAAAARIHGDAVHVLIDLAGHTAHNRLPVFARRPAPRQLAWLGYCGSTGLAAIDAVLGDPQVTPAAEQGHFVERIVRLPETYFCFTPPAEAIEVGALPALASGALTFGCFNNAAKLGDAVVALWSRLLQSLPGSRLLLKNRQLADPAFAQSLAQRFQAQGLAPAQLLLEGPTDRADYLRAYQRVDIALDPFPFPGATTSLEGLWMGVPVITRRGSRFVAHNGETIAANAGLADWIAADEEAYLALGRRWAADLDGLARLRAGLRRQVLASPLFDAARFARYFEAALLDLWTA